MRNLQECPNGCGRRHANGIATRTNCVRFRDDARPTAGTAASSVPKRESAPVKAERTWVHNWFDERMTPPNNPEPLDTPDRLLVEQAMKKLADTHNSGQRMLSANRRASDDDYARYTYMSKYGTEFLQGNPTREQIAERARLEEEFYGAHKGKRTRAGGKVAGTGASRAILVDLNRQLDTLDRRLSDERVRGPVLNSAKAFREHVDRPNRQFVVQTVDAASMESPFARHLGDDVAIRPAQDGNHLLAASLSASPSRMPEIKDGDISDASEDGFTLFAGTPRETRLVYSPQSWV